MKKVFSILSILLFPCVTYNQQIENRFIDALINNKSTISDFIDNDELNRSERLGINYSGVTYKWLISFDVPDDIKTGFREGKYNYTLQTMQLEDGFSVVTLAVGSVNYLQKFYFLNNKFVSPSRYFTRNWEKKNSKYFMFRISEAKYFNDYCVKRLDDFVDSLCNLLNIDPERKRVLENEKIDYTFCKDEDEVEKITGYKSKGMSVLAFDEVITAYQTHFHEVAHLLINYKLQNLGLYTLPFFMEGFAVAVGGRGGLAPRVVTDLGYYLQKTGILTYDSILTFESFFNQDANMTYAVSGLYNRFLLDELGSTKYLDLYKKANGDLNFVESIKLEEISVPLGSDIGIQLKRYYENRQILINVLDSSYDVSARGKFSYEGEDYYGFNWAKDIRIYLTPDMDTNYISRQFFELFPGRKYACEKYGIIIEESSITIHNLLNCEIIASLNQVFVTEPEVWDRKFFLIRADVFEDDLNKKTFFITSPNN